MPPPSRYPEAIWRGDGVSGGTYTNGPFKVVLHTTETRTIPGYNNGNSAPQLTYFPAGRYFVQHTSLLVAGRAMVNGTNPVQTNRDGAIQLEIVCYSNKPIADSVNGLWVGHLTDDQLGDIARFLRWVSLHYGVSLTWTGKMAYSYAQANAPGYRMSIAQWDAFNGVTRHQEVPDGNTHWDTGALNMTRLMELAGEDSMSLSPQEEQFVKEMYASAVLTQGTPNGSAFGAFVKFIRALRKVDDIFDLEEF